MSDNKTKDASLVQSDGAAIVPPDNTNAVKTDNAVIVQSDDTTSVQDNTIAVQSYDTTPVQDNSVVVQSDDTPPVQDNTIAVKSGSVAIVQPDNPESDSTDIATPAPKKQKLKKNKKSAIVQPDNVDIVQPDKTTSAQPDNASPAQPDNPKPAPKKQNYGIVVRAERRFFKGSVLDVPSLLYKSLFLAALAYVYWNYYFEKYLIMAGVTFAVALLGCLSSWCFAKRDENGKLCVTKLSTVVSAVIKLLYLGFFVCHSLIIAKDKIWGSFDLQRYRVTATIITAAFLISCIWGLAKSVKVLICTKGGMETKITAFEFYW